MEPKPPTPQPIYLSEEQIEYIATKSAQKAIEALTDGAYKAVGRAVLSKLTVAIGVVAVSLLIYFNHIFGAPK